MAQKATRNSIVGQILDRAGITDQQVVAALEFVAQMQRQNIAVDRKRQQAQGRIQAHLKCSDSQAAMLLEIAVQYLKLGSPDLTAAGYESISSVDEAISTQRKQAKRIETLEAENAELRKQVQAAAVPV